MKTIKEWAPEDRPRERLLAYGAETLSKAELLAILIGSGVPGKSAVDIMRTILSDYGDSLMSLAKASVQELMRYEGIGEAKAVTSAYDVLSEFTDDAGNDILNGEAKKVTFTSLGPVGQEIYMALLQGEKNADELLDWIDCSAQDLNAALTRLLFDEIIQQLPGRVYALDTIHTVVTFDQ